MELFWDLVGGGLTLSKTVQPVDGALCLIRELCDLLGHRGKEVSGC